MSNIQPSQFPTGVSAYEVLLKEGNADPSNGSQEGVITLPLLEVEDSNTNPSSPETITYAPNGTFYIGTSTHIESFNINSSSTTPYQFHLGSLDMTTIDASYNITAGLAYYNDHIYAVDGASGKIYKLDVSDPENITFISSYYHASLVGATSIDVSNNIIAVTTPAGAGQIFLVETDNMTIINTIAEPKIVGHAKAKILGEALISTAYDGSTTFITIIDISDPDNPSLGTPFDTGLTTFSDSEVIDVIVYVGGADTAESPANVIKLIDISKPSSMAIICTFTTSTGLVTNITPFGDYILTSFRNEGLITIVNVRDRSAPIEVVPSITLNTPVGSIVYNNKAIGVSYFHFFKVYDINGFFLPSLSTGTLTSESDVNIKRDLNVAGEANLKNVAIKNLKLDKFSGNLKVERITPPNPTATLSVTSVTGGSGSLLTAYITGTQNITATNNLTATNGNITASNGNIAAPNGTVTSQNLPVNQVGINSLADMHSLLFNALEDRYELKADTTYIFPGADIPFDLDYPVYFEHDAEVRKAYFRTSPTYTIARPTEDFIVAEDEMNFRESLVVYNGVGTAISIPNNGVVSRLVELQVAAPSGTVISVDATHTVIQFTNATGAFSIGDTITGGSSFATAKVKAVTALPSLDGILYLHDVIGVFQAGEGLDNGSGTTASVMPDGSLIITYKSLTAAFSEGETLTGLYSNTTAIIDHIVITGADTGVLVLSSVSDKFYPEEPATTATGSGVIVVETNTQITDKLSYLLLNEFVVADIDQLGSGMTLGSIKNVTLTGSNWAMINFAAALELSYMRSFSLDIVEFITSVTTGLAGGFIKVSGFNGRIEMSRCALKIIGPNQAGIYFDPAGYYPGISITGCTPEFILGADTTQFFVTGGLNQKSAYVKAVGNFGVPDSTTSLDASFGPTVEVTTETNLTNDFTHINGSLKINSSERITAATRIYFTGLTNGPFLVGDTVTGTNGTGVIVEVNTTWIEINITTGYFADGTLTVDRDPDPDTTATIATPDDTTPATVYTEFHYTGSEPQTIQLAGGVTMHPVSGTGIYMEVSVAKNEAVISKSITSLAINSADPATILFYPTKIEMNPSDHVEIRIRNADTAANCVVSACSLTISI